MHPRHCVVMTFPANKLDEYGFCMAGFLKNWPKSVQGYAYVEGASDLRHYETANFTVVDFEECVGADVEKFVSRNRSYNIEDLSTFGDINSQAGKFARKAFVQMHALKNIPCDFLHYIDADLFTHELTVDDIESYLDSDALLFCVPRWWKKEGNPIKSLYNNTLHIGYTETGLIVWNKRHPDLTFWLNEYKRCYEEDIIFTFKAWHDCIAFDYATLSTIERFGTVIRDLSYGHRGNNPLVSGPLGRHFDHMKGERKFSGYSDEWILAHGKFTDKCRLFLQRLMSIISFGR